MSEEIIQKYSNAYTEVNSDIRQLAHYVLKISLFISVGNCSR